MKIKILQENLASAVNLAFYFVSASPRLPVLSNIYFAAKKTGLVVMATDLETGIKKEVPAKIEKEGKITASAKTITELVSFLPKETVELSLEKEQLKISCGKTFASLPTIGADEFPGFVDWDKKKKGVKKFSFKGEELFSWIKKVGFAASDDESRPALTGIYLRQGEEGVEMIATDGYRLSKVMIGKKKWEADINIPADSFQMLEKVVDKGEDLDFFVSSKEGQVLFSQNGTWVTTRLIKEEYPDFSKIIPGKSETQMVVNKEEFLRAVRAASIFARESANIVRLKTKGGNLVISANAPQTGENKVEIEVEKKGEDVEIAFNFRFILDFLSVVEADEVEIGLFGGLKPGVFREKGNKAFLHVVMPVRIKE